MKKFLCVAFIGMTLGLTSCSEDDVVGFNCERIDAELREPAEKAIEAYNANTEPEQTDALCEAAKKAINEYRNSLCGSETSFASEYNSLLGTCPDPEPDPAG